MELSTHDNNDRELPKLPNVCIVDSFFLCLSEQHQTAGT